MFQVKTEDGGVTAGWKEEVGNTKRKAFVIVGVSASVPPLGPDTLFHVAGAALHLSMYLFKQLGRRPLRGPCTAASSLPTRLFLKKAVALA